VRRIPYPLLCAVLGLALGWIPAFVHGPIPEKYNVLYIQGAIAVWAWYTARLAIGFVVGITRWPARWWLRGPMCGLLMVGPLSLVSLATPGCRLPCMVMNDTSAVTIGLVVAGLARLLTGRDHLDA
jgi:hypothetical protein